MKERGEIQKEFYGQNRITGNHQNIIEDRNQSGLFNEFAGK
jgi:hypothetical protein